MSKLEELIQQYCPDGVDYKPLWQLTAWDKKFNSVERYKQNKVIKYKTLLAKDLFALKQEQGDVFLLSTGEETGWTTKEIAGENVSNGEIVAIPWGKSRPLSEVLKYHKGDFVSADNRIATSIEPSVLDNKFLYYYLQSKGDIIDSFYRGSSLEHPDMSKVLDFIIPVPPLPVQEEIVRILDTFIELQTELQTELQKRLQQYKFYRDCLLGGFSTDTNVKTKAISELSDFRRGSFPQPYTRQDFYGGLGAMPFVQVADVDEEGFRLVSQTKQTISKIAQPSSVFVPQGTIICTLQGTIGKVAITQYDAYVDRTLAIFTNISNTVLHKYFAYQLKAKFDIEKEKARGSTIKTITKEEFSKFEIPVPSLAEQQRIVDILDRFDTITTDLTAGLPAEIEKRKQQYEFYRDKLLTFKRA